VIKYASSRGTSKCPPITNQALSRTAACIPADLRETKWKAHWSSRGQEATLLILFVVSARTNKRHHHH
jgi:hypothetical protein